MREIIVTIDSGGNTKIETRGFKGSECLKATAELEAKLGATTHDTKTREFSERATQEQGIRQTTR
jgi:hypothetical protein